VNDELERILIKAVVAYVKTLSQPVGIEENHENSE
jgi:hypothetical protein